jgi:hypothetical protein
LPAPIAGMQAQIEHLYLACLTLERDVQDLRAIHPILMKRSSRPGPFARLILRLVPRAALRRQVQMVRHSGLFDAAWYLRKNSDVAKGGMDPAMHYLLHGGQDLRDPGPWFDTAHYLRLYPDISANGVNPLVHYITAGIDEGRSIRPDMPCRVGAPSLPA